MNWRNHYYTNWCMHWKNIEDGKRVSHDEYASFDTNMWNTNILLFICWKHSFPDVKQHIYEPSLRHIIAFSHLANMLVQCDKFASSREGGWGWGRWEYPCTLELNLWPWQCQCAAPLTLCLEHFLTLTSSGETTSKAGNLIPALWSQESLINHPTKCRHIKVLTWR